MVVMEIDLGNGKMVMKAKNKMDKRKKIRLQPTLIP